MKPDFFISLPRIVTAGLSGDAGKSLVSSALTANLVERGFMVSAFKKGPDYIDAAWLGLAAGRPARNLDTFLMSNEALHASLTLDEQCDLAIIEGNRGLFDGLTEDGAHSTATLARRIGAPVLLVLDVTKTTRTAAALVRGCQVMDPALNIAGVVLNRCASSRQEKLIRNVIEKECGIEVMGALPEFKDDPLPARRFGLICVQEQRDADERICKLKEAGRRYINIDAVVCAAKTAAPLLKSGLELFKPKRPLRKTVGVLKGRAFSFYYPENSAALNQEGIRLEDIDPETAPEVPSSMDGLFIGGGFPEVFAESLAKNTSFIESLRHRVKQGLPVYAECGGLMYLARSIIKGNSAFNMSNVLPFDVRQTDRPAGHGYVECTADQKNPFFEVGLCLRGHEFHYSMPVEMSNDTKTALSVKRGVGLGNLRDGAMQGNVFASYTHVHALGTPDWAPSFWAALQ